MKKSTRLISIILLLTLFANNSCKREATSNRGATNTNDAILTGPDQRVCLCCGGMMITFNGETKPYTGEFRQISNVSDLGITPQDTFPIYVNVDWKEDTTNVCKWIFITRIKRR